jgi:hypothetical protein
VTAAEVDVDTLPPTQYLVMDVLAARWRTGEQCWTFPARLAATMGALAAAGLIEWKAGVVERTVMAWLTEAGRRRVLLETYEAPGWKTEREALARGMDAEARWLHEQSAKGSDTERHEYRVRAISWDDAARLVRGAR